MPEESRAQEPAQIRQMQVEHLRFAYPQAKEIIHDLSFTAHAGEIIGITGPVACGKSTLGKVFLCEYPYEGSIRFDDVEPVSYTHLDQGSRASGYAQLSVYDAVFE